MSTGTAAEARAYELGRQAAFKQVKDLLDRGILRNRLMNHEMTRGGVGTGHPTVEIGYWEAHALLKLVEAGAKGSPGVPV